MEISSTGRDIYCGQTYLDISTMAKHHGIMYVCIIGHHSRPNLLFTTSDTNQR